LNSKSKRKLAGAKKILKLDSFAIQEDFFADVALIGISSSKAIYSLCALFNEMFNLSFTRFPELDVKIIQSDNEVSFPIYRHEVLLSAANYTLYKLNTEDAKLLPALKNIDYIWLIASEDAFDEANLYLTHLRNVPEIQFASLLEIDKIKNKEYLIL
jgi:hypothetical protein